MTCGGCFYIKSQIFSKKFFDFFYYIEIFHLLMLHRHGKQSEVSGLRPDRAVLLFLFAYCLPFTAFVSVNLGATCKNITSNFISQINLQAVTCRIKTFAKE